jgi:hypothetical protein
MPPAASVFVGIDVAKAELVMAMHPSGERWTATNDDAGLQRLLTLANLPRRIGSTPTRWPCSPSARGLSRAS